VNTMKKSWWMTGWFLAALAGCGGGDQQAGGSFQRPPTPVEAATVAIEGVTDRFTTLGTLEASEAITVTGEIDGIIVAIPFREKSIVDQGAGAPQDLDDALAALKVAEANLALAETRLAKTRITAPFDGLAGKRRVSKGAFLRAGSPITTLAQIDRLRVAFAVPERILSSLHVGAEVSVTTTAFPGQVLIGTIDVIEPQLDPLTRNVSVLALVDNPEELLRPGMSASVEVVLSQRANAITVPSDAVFVEGGQAYVYVIKPDSVVTRTAVVLGSRLAGAVEVTGGVTAGQQVVKAGHQKLYEGAKVAPVDTQGEEGGQVQ